MSAREHTSMTAQQHNTTPVFQTSRSAADETARWAEPNRPSGSLDRGMRDSRDAARAGEATWPEPAARFPGHLLLDATSACAAPSLRQPPFSRQQSALRPCRSVVQVPSAARVWEPTPDVGPPPNLPPPLLPSRWRVVRTRQRRHRRRRSVDLRRRGSRLLSACCRCRSGSRE